MHWSLSTRCAAKKKQSIANSWQLEAVQLLKAIKHVHGLRSKLFLLTFEFPDLFFTDPRVRCSLLPTFLVTNPRVLAYPRARLIHRDVKPANLLLSGSRPTVLWVLTSHPKVHCCNMTLEAGPVWLCDRTVEVWKWWYPRPHHAGNRCSTAGRRGTMLRDIWRFL